MRDESESRLVQQIAAGGSAALEELSRRYTPFLRAEAYRILGDPDDAADVAQEVLWKVWRHAGEYDPAKASVSTWIGVMTRRLAIDRLRQRQRRLRLLDEQPRESEAILPEAPERVHAHHQSRVVRRALRELPREQRKIVELMYFREMSQREIALATGIPLGTVKTRAGMAVRRLRQVLAA
ncbi:MAG TPA: sigma-70 family RNA polymerase sigma factor [Thermoanaerobaculia bacterium]|nr:sigma-70 family RNA polymerase sigma factor [Thermoanaerobaculia bacterium]